MVFAESDVSVSRVNNQRIKIVFLGEQSSGKTSIVTRFVYDHFVPNYAATIGIDFLSKVVSVNGRQMRLQLWDTAGQERFKSLMPSYIRDSSAAIVVYDVTVRESFDKTSQWVQDIKSRMLIACKNPIFTTVRGDKAVIAIVGNKTDLQDRRKVSYDEGLAHATEMGCLFCETSAKNGDCINELFMTVGGELLKTLEPVTTSHKLVDINLSPSATAETSTCTGRTRTMFAAVTQPCRST